MGDSYRPPPPRDRNDGRGDAGFNFRGAADNYRPPSQYRPEERFTFKQPSGPAAPRFPAQQPPPRGPQSNRNGTNKRRDRGPGGRQRGGGQQPFRRIPKPAHARDILKHKERETTPEQLEGMNTEGQSRFMDRESSSEDDEADKSDSDENANEGSRKRVKTAEATAEPARPKWSNPDPYSALPPTDLGLQPKKDIVKTIRKAKVDASAQKMASNAIKDNADFISFDFHDEQDDEEDRDDQNDRHDDEEEEGEVDHSSARPMDLWMPTDQELMETYGRPEPRGKKRKYEPEQSSRAGLIVTEWRANRSNPTPWFKRDQKFMASKGLQLHMEIVDFYDYVRPYPHEHDIRTDLIKRVEQAVRDFGGGVQLDVRVRSFGSFASDLYLPTADMDLVAVSRTYEMGGNPAFCISNSSKHKLSRHLGNWKVCKPGSMNPVVKAKVPILKFVDKKTDIKVDISFENNSGLTAIQTFHTWKDQFPEMPPLVMVIKQFLAMRGLNEVHSGGLGGFTIICLVVSMLQLMPANKRQSVETQSQYGQLLLHFFDLYGNKFNLQETGITMKPPGYFDKRQPGACKAKINATGLTIIDPNNDRNDISGGSRRVADVFKCFRGAMHEIQDQLAKLHRGEASNPTALGCILAGNYTSFAEQRDILDEIDRRERPPSPLVLRPDAPAASYDQPPPSMASRAPAPSTYEDPPSPFASRPRAPPPSYFAPPPPPTQYPWQQYSPQAPTPARDGYYHTSQSAHGLPPSRAPLPQPPQSQHPWQQQNYQAVPPPGQLGQGVQPQPGNIKLSKNARKRAKQAQNASQNTTAEPTKKKSRSQKIREKKERKRLQTQQNNEATAGNNKPNVKKTQEEKEHEKREKSKKGREERAAKRLKTLYGDVP